MNSIDGGDNFGTFRDCLSVAIITKLSSPKTQKSKKSSGRRGRNSRKDVSATLLDDRGTENITELGDFVDYLAEEIFSSFPEDLRCISYASVQDDNALAGRYGVPLDTDIQSELIRTLPPTVSDSLCTYGFVEEPSDLERFLEPAMNSYLTAATAPPPEYTPSLADSRPAGCEICDREHLPLTYHHLIPRQIHSKAVKRGWHKEWELNKCAWVCRACHSFIHKCSSNEDLARFYYDIDLLLEREDVQRFAAWVGRIRWKAR